MPADAKAEPGHCGAESAGGWVRGTAHGRCIMAKHLEPKPSEILDRVPPNSLEAEMGVIGSVILLPAVYQEIRPPLDAGDFHSTANGAIWRRMREAMDAGEPIDTTLLAERLKQAGEWKDCGGAAYLAEVLHSVAVPNHAAYYAAIVREKAGLRRLIALLCETLRDCYEDSASFKDGPLVEKLKELAEKLGRYRKGKA